MLYDRIVQCIGMGRMELAFKLFFQIPRFCEPANFQEFNDWLINFFVRIVYSKGRMLCYIIANPFLDYSSYIFVLSLLPLSTYEQHKLKINSKIKLHK